VKEKLCIAGLGKRQRQATRLPIGLFGQYGLPVIYFSCIFSLCPSIIEANLSMCRWHAQRMKWNGIRLEWKREWQIQEKREVNWMG
jgi:hypothetical protein